MVHTRGQRVKEENEIKLAKQQSLAEQLQQTSIPIQLQNELDAAPVSQQDIPQQNIAGQHIVKQNVAEQHIAEQDVVQQDIFGEVSARLIGETSAFESTLVEYAGNESRPSAKDVRGPVKPMVKENSSIKTEIRDSKRVNDISTQFRNEILSEAKTGEEKVPATLTNLPVLGENDRGLTASGSEQSKKYFLRNRVEKTANIPSAKAKESTVALAAPKNHVASVMDSDEDIYNAARNIVDEPPDTSSHHDEKGEGSNDTYQPNLTPKRNTKRKATPQKTTTSKTTTKQRPTVSRATSKIVGGFALRLRKVVTDDVQADISLNKNLVHMKGHKASITGSVHSSLAVKVQKKKKRTTTKSKVDGKSFKTPINPEDGEDFIQYNNSAVDAQRKHGLRERSNGSRDKKKTLSGARSPSTKSSTVWSTKKTHARAVAKTLQRDNDKQKLIVKLTFSGKALAKLAKKTKKTPLKRVKTPKGFFSNKYRFKLRWTPFEEYPQVDRQTYQDVYDLLSDSLIPFEISLDRKSDDPAVVSDPQGPMHASDAVTVDAVVKVIMSQATDNEKALLAQAKLIKAFPYMVNGKTVVGKIPNYHDVRTADFAKLAGALSPAGLQKKRAEIIPECLNAIRRKNIDLNSPGCSIDSNPLNAADFVPGSLSLDYLAKLNSQEKLDELVSLPGIGIKTAACILSFSFQLPVFAVDTHVFRMVKWLGWVPEGCNRNDASAHLDMLIPDHLKYGLHQGFWHHGQKCLRCKARNDQKTKGWEKTVCVLEEFLKRQPRKERKSPAQKRKRDAEDSGDADSPQPKAQKGDKIIMVNSDWTVEQAAEKGYVPYLKYDVDDNFRTKGANVTHTRKVWIKNTA